MEKEIRYRVYYKGNYNNISHSGFWYSDSYIDIEDARNILKYKSRQEGFAEGHIKEEVTTKRIFE